MSRLYVQSEGTAARRRFPVYLVDATDGITPETGEAAGQPQISKAGGAWANTTATLSAIGNGAYYVELTATELNTLGSIQVRYKSANTAEFNMDGEVVAINIHDAQRMGLTALPAVDSGSAGGLITSGTGTSQLSVSSGRANADVTHIATVAVNTGTAQLGVNVVNFGGAAGTFSGGRPEVNTTHAAGTAWGSGAITAASIASSAITSAKFAAGAITASVIATDAIDADALATDAIAEINATVDTALADIRLDELLSADSDIDGAQPPTVGSVFHELMTKTTGSFTYDQTTDSLEAVRDRGDAAWITATGFSTHTAADVWSSGTRTLTGLDEDTTTLDLDATIRAAVGLASANLDTQIGTLATSSALSTVSTNVSTAVTQTTAASIRSAVGMASANLDTQIGSVATASALTTVGNNVSAVKAKTDNLPSSVDGKTLQEWYQIVGATTGGKLSGAQTGTEVFVGLDGTTVRVTASVDASGNRTAIVYG